MALAEKSTSEADCCLKLYPEKNNTNIILDPKSNIQNGVASPDSTVFVPGGFLADQSSRVLIRYISNKALQRSPKSNSRNNGPSLTRSNKEKYHLQWAYDYTHTPGHLSSLFVLIPHPGPFAHCFLSSEKPVFIFYTASMEILEQRQTRNTLHSTQPTLDHAFVSASTPCLENLSIIRGVV